MSKKALVGFAGGGIVLVLVLYCAYSMLTYGALILPISTTCTLGVSGTAANITLSGITADQACTRELTNNKAFYRVSQTPQGIELCEGDIQNNRITLHYIVRDSGFLDLVGSLLCKQFRQGTATLSSSATQSIPSPIPTPATNSVFISDAAGVLDHSRIRDEVSSLPNHLAIYTANNYAGSTTTFDEAAVKAIHNSQSIVMAISTNLQHLAIVGGTNVGLSNNQYNDAVNAFISKYRNDHDYTNATIASIDSLKSCLGV